MPSLVASSSCLAAIATRLDDLGDERELLPLPFDASESETLLLPPLRTLLSKADVVGAPKASSDARALLGEEESLSVPLEESESESDPLSSSVETSLPVDAIAPKVPPPAIAPSAAA